MIGGFRLFKLAKLALIAIAVLALMYLWGSGQLSMFVDFCSATLKSL